MPRKTIDYSQTVIYKICCKELTVKEVYVGSTTSIIKRRSMHKHNCTNEKGKVYNLYVYQFIREHGGFENWDVIVIEEYPCENDEQKRTRERHWYEFLGAELNMKRPLVTVQEIKEEKKEGHAKYYIENKEKIKENNKEYHINNIDKIKEYNKEYQIDNADKIKEYHAKYSIEHKEEKKEYHAKYYIEHKEENKTKIITCMCGSKYQFGYKAKHLRSAKHINPLQMPFPVVLPA